MSSRVTMSRLRAIPLFSSARAERTRNPRRGGIAARRPMTILTAIVLINSCAAIRGCPRSAPHAAQARGDIDRRASAGAGFRLRTGGRPGAALEAVEHGGGDEARARGVDVAIAVRALLMGEEALRRDQVQVILGAGHGDVEQAALFLDLRRRARGEIRRNAAVDRIEE